MTKTPTETPSNSSRAKRWTWTDMTAGDEAGAADVGDYTNLTFQVSGNLGAAMVQIVGRIGDSFDQVNDVIGMPLTFHAPGIKATLELAGEVKPVIVNADKSTKITIALIARK